MPDIKTTTPDRLAKMKDLLKQIGGGEELTAQFGELLEGWTTEQKTILEGKYKAKLEAAKTLCVEEVKQFKTDLAKRVQIFFEAKAEKIESQMAKQVAIKESSAEADLKNIKALLEGVQVNANGDVDLKALQSDLRSLQKKVSTITEERNQAVTRANRSNEIAQKALQRNRVLEEAAKKAVPSPTAAPIAESVAPAAPAAPAKAPEIPIRRTSAQPSTSRVVSESVTMPPKGKPQGQSQPTGSMAAWDPNNVAASMPE